MRESRQRNPGYDKAYYHKHPEIAKSRVRVRRAIKQGRIKHPTAFTCSMAGCKNEAKHYHHLSYGNPAQIATVCVACHAQIHSGDASERDLTAVYTLTTDGNWGSWEGAINTAFLAFGDISESHQHLKRTTDLMDEQ